MTPDGWINWYFEQRDQLGAGGQGLVRTTGRIYHPTCDAILRRSGGRRTCGSPHRRWKITTGIWVCAACGSDWPYDERVQLRGEVQESRRGGHDPAHVRWIDVGATLRRFLDAERWHWESRLYVANAVGRSIRRLVELGSAEFSNLEPDFNWTKRQLHDRVVTGRNEWTRRLRGVGIAFECEVWEAA